MSIFAAMLAAGLMFAFSRTLWAYATIAEVYTLNALLTLLIIFLMFRWRRIVYGGGRERIALRGSISIRAGDGRSSRDNRVDVAGARLPGLSNGGRGLL